MVGGGDTLYVATGGVASGATLAGGSDIVQGGTAIATAVTAGGTETVRGGVVSSSTVGAGGVEFVSSGGTAIATHVTNDGLALVSSGGNLSAATIAAGGSAVVSQGGSAGGVTIDASGLLMLNSGATAYGSLVFAGGGASAVIGGTVLPTVPISGFGPGNTIDLANISGASGLLNLLTDVLTISAGGLLQTLNLVGNYAGETPQWTPDAGSGTDLTFACFLAGTLIRTPDGEVPVETLTAGDRVLTLDGTAMPVRWLAVQSVSQRFADPLRVLPVRIRAGALGGGVPRRDLLLSPGHALLLDGLLVQAGALVNGTSVVRATGLLEVFRYYHVELPTHAVIFAEAAAAESFLEGVEAFGFDNGAARGPAEVAAVPLPYPRVMAQRQVPQAIRQRLAAWPATTARDVAA
jgi:autotransporter passenger strand-loop-strand repeat protein